MVGSGSNVVTHTPFSCWVIRRADVSNIWLLVDNCAPCALQLLLGEIRRGMHLQCADMYGERTRVSYKDEIVQSSNGSFVITTWVV